MAGEPSLAVADSAADSLLALDPELLATFRQESEDHLRTINRLLPSLLEAPGSPGVPGARTHPDDVALSRSPGSRDALQDIRRSVHTLKGSAAMIGLPELTRLAHRMEDLLDLLYEAHRPITPETTALLVTATDALEELSAGTVDPPTLAGLHQRLERHTAGTRTESAAAPTLSQRKPRPVPRILAIPGAPPLLGTGPPPRFEKYVRVSLERLDELTRLIGELAETTVGTSTIAHELGTLPGDFEAALNRQARLARALREQLARMRLVPLAHISGRLQRTVRAVARLQNKAIDLVLEGENTELDKVVLEELAEPLLHLLRNAADHGIESPETRRQRGKSETGTIRIRASREELPHGNVSQVILEISDDGGGVDLPAVRQTAALHGVPLADGTVLPDQEVLDLLSRPGFSTAQQVSEVSGRGVGLDIVKTRVERLGGTVAFSSRPGAGTSFTLRLPAVRQGL